MAGLSQGVVGGRLGGVSESGATVGLDFVERGEVVLSVLLQEVLDDQGVLLDGLSLTLGAPLESAALPLETPLSDGLHLLVDDLLLLLVVPQVEQEGWLGEGGVGGVSVIACVFHN